MEPDPEATNIMLQIIILAILTLISTFFVGSKMAVVSINKNKIRRLTEQGNRNAMLTERLMEDPTVFPLAIRVVITLADPFSSASTTTGIAQTLVVKMEVWNMPYSQVLTGVVVTLTLVYSNLVFGELVPERITSQKIQDFSLLCVRPVYYISQVMNPFIRLLSFSTGGFPKLIRMYSGSLETDVSEEETKSMSETGSETGVFNDTEREMIVSISSFDDRWAREVMIPHQNMVVIGINDLVEGYIDEVLQPIYSKMPIYEGGIDNIIGVLSIKALTIEARRKSLDGPDIHFLLMPPCFVPENRRADALLRGMQKDKIKLVILIDEYGGVADMITLEDLIEEIMGEIHGEYEEVEPEVLELELRRIYRISGDISLFDLKEEMCLHMDSSCDALSGYLMERLDYISGQAELPVIVVTGEADYEIEAVSYIHL